MPRPFCVVSDSCYNGSRIGGKNELIMKYSAFNTSGKREPERTEGDLLLLALVSNTGSVSVQIQSPDGASVFDAERLAEGHYEIQMDRDRT